MRCSEDLGLGEAEKLLLYMNLPAAQTLYNLRDQETEIAVIMEEIGQEVRMQAPYFHNR